MILILCLIFLETDQLQSLELFYFCLLNYPTLITNIHTFYSKLQPSRNYNHFWLPLYQLGNTVYKGLMYIKFSNCFQEVSHLVTVLTHSTFFNPD